MSYEAKTHSNRRAKWASWRSGGSITGPLVDHCTRHSLWVTQTPAGSTRSLLETHNNSWGSKRNPTYKWAHTGCSILTGYRPSVQPPCYANIYMSWCSQRYIHYHHMVELISWCHSATVIFSAKTHVLVVKTLCTAGLSAHHLSAIGGGKGFKLLMHSPKS